MSESERLLLRTPGTESSLPGQEKDSSHFITALNCCPAQDGQKDYMVRISPLVVGSVGAAINSGTHAGGQHPLRIAQMN